MNVYINERISTKLYLVPKNQNPNEFLSKIREKICSNIVINRFAKIIM